MAIKTVKNWWKKWTAQIGAVLTVLGAAESFLSVLRESYAWAGEVSAAVGIVIIIVSAVKQESVSGE